MQSGGVAAGHISKAMSSREILHTKRTAARDGISMRPMEKRQKTENIGVKFFTDRNIDINFSMLRIKKADAQLIHQLFKF